MCRIRILIILVAGGIFFIGQVVHPQASRSYRRNELLPFLYSSITKELISKSRYEYATGKLSVESR